MTADPRPRDILATVGHVDGQVWPGADLLRARRERDFPAWPDWPLLPSQGAHALVNLDMAPLRRNRSRMVPLSGPWLPWGAFQSRALHGFWAHFDRKLGEGADELRLVLDVARTPARSVPTRTKRGPCLFPPSRPPAWDVGVRLGASLRRAASEAVAARSNDSRWALFLSGFAELGQGPWPHENRPRRPGSQCARIVAAQMPAATTWAAAHIRRSDSLLLLSHQLEQASAAAVADIGKLDAELAPIRVCFRLDPDHLSDNLDRRLRGERIEPQQQMRFEGQALGSGQAHARRADVLRQQFQVAGEEPARDLRRVDGSGVGGSRTPTSFCQFILGHFEVARREVEVSASPLTPRSCDRQFLSC